MFVIQAIYEGAKELPPREGWTPATLVSLRDPELFERFQFVAPPEVGAVLANIPAGSVIRAELEVRRAQLRDVKGAFYKLRIRRILTAPEEAAA